MRLLVAVDLRGNAEQVVNQTLEFVGTNQGATIDLVFIDDSRVGLPYIHDSQVRELMEKEWAAYRTKDLDELDRLVKLAPEANRGAVHVKEGSPAETLVEMGASYSAIVVCTHGRTGMARLFVGSVAERVVRTASVPVLVLRNKNAQ